MRRRWVVLAMGVLVLAVLAALAWAWTSGRLPRPGAAKAKAAAAAASAASAPLQFRANELVAPALQAMPQVIEFSGPLVAPGSALLRAKTTGTLLSLSVAEGDRVAAGQTVGRIDQPELGSRLAERSAQIDAVRASLAQAERSHASNERLAQQQFISPVALEASRATLDAARANLQAAQAAQETTRIGQRDALLVAPIAGIVAKRHVLPGEKVSAEQLVLSLVDLRQLELAGAVPTHEVARLSPGMAVTVLAEGLEQPMQARLTRIAPSAEPGTRSIGVVVRLPNADERLRAGQYAMARVVLADERQRLTVPITAVGSTSGQSHVWALANGKLLRRAITTGRRDEAAGRVEVLTGLGPDETVLAARFDNLREGAAALVLPAGAAAAPAAAKASPMAPAAPSVAASVASR